MDLLFFAQSSLRFSQIVTVCTKPTTLYRMNHSRTTYSELQLGFASHNRKSNTDCRWYQAAISAVRHNAQSYVTDAGPLFASTITTGGATYALRPSI